MLKVTSSFAQSHKINLVSIYTVARYKKYLVVLKGIFSLITFVKISDEKDIKTTVYLYIYSEREREDNGNDNKNNSFVLWFLIFNFVISFGFNCLFQRKLPSYACVI